MNTLVSLPIVAALPVAAPAMPSTAAADHSMLDAELVQAAHDMQAADRGISDLHDRFGDDANSRSDYLALEDKRNDHIATLIAVPALSAAGVQAKAEVLRLKQLIEDFDQHQQVAVSLADDIAERGLPLRPVSERLPDPVYAAIEAHEKAYVACRAACAESNRLCELADRIAGKHVVTIPDLRVAGDIDPHFYHLPVAYEQSGVKFFEAPTTCYVDVYLPGDENAQLRQGFYRQLKKIEKARTAVYGDIDAVVTGPSSDEANAVDELIDTVPTTLAGLLAFMTYLAKARRRDPDVFYEQHFEPLIATLGKAAAIIS